MSFNDYVKFVTEQFVRRIDQPKEERRMAREQRKAERLSLSSHVFGVLPMGLSLLLNRRGKANKRKRK
ncbi:YqzE family protein [Halalkalibacter urbisdiaboli]|uniref:YqzE family protein n=1 Tax=Halalkalibacter urbisdiaboli TaxID=1960589 RepID=UPI000B43DB5A|nr:YqzE family protein [Halalkalibacter urbisdiaboli]